MTAQQLQAELNRSLLRAEQQRHLAEEKRRKAQERDKKATHRCYLLVGGKVCTTFPHLQAPKLQEGGIELRQRDAVLSYLKSHDELVQTILKEVQ